MFLVTNFHLEYLEFAMKTTLGSDWADFFDLRLVHARKPLFTKSEFPFFAVDREANTLRGQIIKSPGSFYRCSKAGIQTYLEGNAKLLTRYFMRKLGKEDVKISFISYVDDDSIFKLNEWLDNNNYRARWQTVAVVSEYNLDTS